MFRQKIAKERISIIYKTLNLGGKPHTRNYHTALAKPNRGRALGCQREITDVVSKAALNTGEGARKVILIMTRIEGKILIVFLSFSYAIIGHVSA